MDSMVSSADISHFDLFENVNYTFCLYLFIIAAVRLVCYEVMYLMTVMHIKFEPIYCNVLKYNL